MSEQFWTLYNFTETSGYPPFKRLIQNRLRERMAKLVQLHPQWDESDYANYFVNILNDDSQPETEKKLAHWHLLAYFDRDRCYLIWRSWCRLPFYAAYAENLYALTNEHLCNREKLRQYLNKYQTSGYSGANLKTYMVGVLRNVTRDHVNWESRWHLLCDVDINSHRKLQKAEERLRSALNNAGTREPEISQYLFAWRYFIPIYKNNRVYNPQRREGGKWPEPDFADFVATAKDYNSQRFQPGAPLQVAVGADVAPAMIQKWMNLCIDALQQSDQIIEVPYDIHSNEPADSGEAIEQDEEQSLSLPAVDLALTSELEIIEQNLDKTRSQIPKSYRQAVMALCYPHRLALLTQEQFASKMSVHQGTVSRYISKNVEAPLIEKFEQLTSEQFNPTVYIKTFLTEKFTRLYRVNPIEAQLMAAIADLDAELQHILKLSYGQKLNINELTQTLSQNQPLSQAEVQAKFSLAHEQLEKSFLNLLKQWQSNYIKSWLKNYYQNLIQSGLLQSCEQLASPHPEILWQRYAQKKDVNNIENLTSKSHADQMLTAAKQELQRLFLQWIDTRFGISLETETQQIGVIIEDWLSTNLLYQEIQRN
ncbi:XRE family transcriptional regulator [Calothrix sp. FACHB-1219]|uniref:XRE family transcriptional regulator n=1 Tax=unclassified Calothrix TaxID=2619626 RepID=UPI0016842613|nr:MULTISPECIES: XRE family transcriptional regulator [unclassified Calothrix]MBD2208056.1 XRE family transcriptional regulator [Calothrix sp. FACHB-168]MBD2222606.1 XRE family transcriptional regulator [Calothrix sp. FACHB-1219]